MNWTEMVLAVMSLLVGFSAGLLTFKRSERWCPVCGGGMICGRCTAIKQRTNSDKQRAGQST